MEKTNQLVMKLSDPGMTHLHKVGLAGLYMTLKKLPEKDFQEFGEWNLFSDRIEFSWKKTPKDFFSPILEKSFQLDSKGLIDFYAHKDHPMGDETRILLHNIIMGTYLQHGSSRKAEKKATEIVIPFEEKEAIYSYKIVKSYNHQTKYTMDAFDKKGNFKEKVSIKNWLLPGGGVRHVQYSIDSELTSSPENVLPLLYAPVATIYFYIRAKSLDGKYDNRKSTALVFPKIKDLSEYQKNYIRYIQAPAESLYVGDVGDAALKALLITNLWGKEVLENSETNSCLVQVMGNVGWNKQQKCRTSSFYIKNIDAHKLNSFVVAYRFFGNARFFSEKNQKLFIRVSSIRALIADNILANTYWYRNFSHLMRSSQLTKLIHFEKKGLTDMVQEENIWCEASDKLMVESIHVALRNRYGALAERAKKSNEKPNFEREFERIRTSLMRTKNASTLRAELADIFARGGINKSLQKNWQKILPLYAGSDWQRAKDLALLALASYSGKGSESVEKIETEED